MADEPSVEDLFVRYMHAAGAACKPEKFKVIIPSEFREQSERLQRGMVKLFDGVTGTKGHGSWLNPGTNTVDSEPVDIYESSHNCTSDGVRRDFATLVRHIGVRARQSAVFVEAGTTFIVRPSQIPMPRRVQDE